MNKMKKAYICLKEENLKNYRARAASIFDLLIR